MSSAGKKEDELYGDAKNNILRGGGGKDLLSGNEGSDRLYGEDGDDIIYAGAGNDVLSGGEGIDWVPFKLNSKTNLNLMTGVAKNSFSGTDTVEGIEIFTFGYGNDSFQGDDHDNVAQLNRGNDVAYGGKGADTISGGAGNDVIYGFSQDDGSRLHGDSLSGDAGTDMISYRFYQFGVTVNLMKGTATDAFGGRDQVVGFERAEGGEGADVLLANLIGDVRLYGRNGDDVLSGGQGDDVLEGGAGEDTVSYADDLKGVTVSLDGGAAFGASTGNDVLKSIEHIRGGDGADVLEGDTARNNIQGGDGADQLFGGDGNDELRGDAGDDVLNGFLGDDVLAGGSGNDVFLFEFNGFNDDSLGRDLIRDFSEGDRLEMRGFAPGFTGVNITRDDGFLVITLDGVRGSIALTGDVFPDAADFLFT